MAEGKAGEGAQGGKHSPRPHSPSQGHHQDENPRTKPSITQGSFRQVAKTQGTPVGAAPGLAAQLGV